MNLSNAGMHPRTTIVGLGGAGFAFPESVPDGGDVGGWVLFVARILFAVYSAYIGATATDPK